LAAFSCEWGVIKGSVPTSHLKPFYIRKALILSGWLEPGEESSEGINPFQRSDEEDLQDEDFHMEE
jgi:hypothetical protein